MKCILKLLLFLTGVLFTSAQQQKDTTAIWRANFSSLSDFIFRSEDANWIGIKKISKLHGDSIFVVNTKDQGRTVYRIVNSQVKFLKEVGVLGKKGQKVVFLNLSTGNTFNFDNIIEVYTLQQQNIFGLLSSDHTLRFYDISAKQNFEITNVSNFTATDSKNRIYLSKVYEGKSEILETNGSEQKVFYKTENKIRKMSLTESGKHLVVLETNQANDQDRIVILETAKSHKKILELNIPKNAVATVSAIQNGDSYLIRARVEGSLQNNPLVNVWYGNDPYVNEPFKMSSNHHFWIWHTKGNKVQRINIPGNFEVRSINNDRYFLTYLPRRGHNFLTSEPELNAAQIYDLKLNSYRDIGDVKYVKRIGKDWPELLNNSIFTSPDGRWFLASQDGMKWSIYRSDGSKVTTLEKLGLEQPVFASKSDRIYFESGDGLWSYNIADKKLTALDIGRGKLTKIKNFSLTTDDYTAIPFLPTEQLLAEVHDRDENEISYQLMKSAKISEIIPATKNRIHKLAYDPAMTSFYTLEENFNLPPTLYTYNKPNEKTLLFNANIKDIGAQKIKQEIYKYSAAGKNLSGILYYPANFDPRKKYPMIVRIYNMQRYLSNYYLSPYKSIPDGSQFRTLLERGYFVFLPDTTVGEEGPGLSALECVHNALDIVLKNPSIDKDKVGLCGQSFGGYKTDFIATHSDRFAAYISGAGISDIINDFYSYSHAWNKPLYFIYNTVYQMNTTPANDKERYLKNNPILNVERVNAPILLWASKKDQIVPPAQTMEFYIGLRRYKKDAVALFYEDGNHSFPDGTAEQIDLSRKVLDWWDYFLKGKNDIAWINKQMRRDAF
ncbi:S9 family peptidase [Sphingobacterium zeae]|uniref:S9 family peptidase n=1 Tax=Sphingobacterium zeae TaxID=1776859 RepID=UPI00360670E3